MSDIIYPKLPLKQPRCPDAPSPINDKEAVDQRLTCACEVGSGECLNKAAWRMGDGAGGWFYVCNHHMDEVEQFSRLIEEMTHEQIIEAEAAIYNAEQSHKPMTTPKPTTIPELKSAEQALFDHIEYNAERIEWHIDNNGETTRKLIRDFFDTTRAHYEAVGRDKGMREAAEIILSCPTNNKECFSQSGRDLYLADTIEHAIHNPDGRNVSDRISNQKGEEIKMKNSPSIPIVVELPNMDKPTEWGVSFNGPNPKEDFWVPCSSKETAWRLHSLVLATIKNTHPSRVPLSNLEANLEIMEGITIMKHELKSAKYWTNHLYNSQTSEERCFEKCQTNAMLHALERVNELCLNHPNRACETSFASNFDCAASIQSLIISIESKEGKV